ncbi:MAG: PSD1 and planctomycete cytochrome C domain-containing protein [Verrucomicrobiales bacterium]
MIPSFHTTMTSATRFFCALAFLAGGGAGLLAADTPAPLSPADTAFFENKVRPLLSKHCYECHAKEGKSIKGGLHLDSRPGWMAGGDSGEVIEPGHPEKSLLIESVRYSNQDLQMPPKYKLNEADIAILEEWIQRGTPDPRVGQVAEKKEIDLVKGRQHWAFRPVTNPPLPKITDTAWAKDGIDHFIRAAQEKAGIHPAPDADRFTLIRRVSLDLIGLPPTVEEVNAFVRDPAPEDEAYAKVVNRLLASERFGERWGRHWLDVARYADSVGKTRNVPFPYAWRYRDYVIDSFNHDKPYHVFIGEQIAGDLMPAGNPAQHDERTIATGLLALGSMDLNEKDREQFTLDQIDDQVDTVGRAFLGLTTGCARCHDHKFDPIPQKDYYALAGIFASTETLSGQKNKGGGGNYFSPNLLANLGSTAPTAASASASEGKSNTGTASPPVVPDENAMRQKMAALQKQAKGKGPGAKSARAELQELRKNMVGIAGKATATKKKKQSQGAGQNIDLKAPLAMSVRDGEVTDLELRVRGEPDIHGEKVPRGFLQVLDTGHAKEMPDGASGRLELARWLADPANPLPARVMANRIWAHLFGQGLVRTVDNFGLSGEAPTNPALLDHLATRFVAQGWSVKSLIRTIVLSRTYRLSGDPSPEGEKIDPSNRLLWRSNLRRIEAEVLRDALLAAGGGLQTERPVGPSVSPAEIAAMLGGKGKRATGSEVFETPVRSVYLPIFRSKLPGMFTVFDFAEPDQVNGQRDVTTVAPQALFLLNNPFVVETATHAAQRVLALEGADDDAKIRYAYAYTLCRKPGDAERERSLAFIKEGGGDEKTWTTFLQALYASAEFRYIR